MQKGIELLDDFLSAALRLVGSITCDSGLVGMIHDLPYEAGIISCFASSVGPTSSARSLVITSTSALEI